MMAVDSAQANSISVRIGSKLSEAFERAEESIRERAYQIFLGRGPEDGDSITDWLAARMEVLAPIDLLVKEQKRNVVVESNLKGFSPQEIEVEVGRDALKVYGLHYESAGGTKPGSAQSTSSAAHFYQSVPLPCDVDIDNSQATLLKNGKLKITLPKKNG